MKKIMQSWVAIGVFALSVSAAHAQLVSSTAAARRAPAPLLAAGIPAFLALGGGAAIGRIVRRRKTAAREEAEARPVFITASWRHD